jgi:cysteinyl-tRNA synthetase
MMAIVQSLRLYNTMTRSVEAFPAAPRPEPLKFYTCGPTVYDDAHIGNFRSFLNADLLRRTLELLGYRVRHVMNITDVGHMTDDATVDGGGEDKMAAASRRLAEARASGRLPESLIVDPSDPGEIANFYAGRFLEDARFLGLKVSLEADEIRAGGGDPGLLMPRATRCIPQMVEMIVELVRRSHAYVGADGAVYFDVRSYPAYGRLSGNAIDALREGAGDRVEASHQAMKRHPSDFLLWKPDPHHLMRWPSPWGEGYPGWHIECSAMARMLLGDEIDVHSGGEDNIFPHHECEIAQSCCATGCSVFARAWFHTRHLLVEGQKMSKSRGNFFTARDLFSRGVTPAALRLELTRTHYRSNANFTMQGLQDCQRMVDRWARAHAQLVSTARDAVDAGRPAPDDCLAPGPFERALGAFVAALCDDLNVARAVAAVNEACASARRSTSSCPHRELCSMLSMDSVLAILGRNKQVRSQGPSADPVFVRQVEELLARRAVARAAKDWSESDRIRDTLASMRVTVKDGPEGVSWERN